MHQPILAPTCPRSHAASTGRLTLWPSHLHTRRPIPMPHSRADHCCAGHDRPICAPSLTPTLCPLPHHCPAELTITLLRDQHRTFVSDASNPRCPKFNPTAVVAHFHSIPAFMKCLEGLSRQGDIDATPPELLYAYVNWGSGLIGRGEHLGPCPLASEVEHLEKFKKVSQGTALLRMVADGHNHWVKGLSTMQQRIFVANLPCRMSRRGPPART